MPPLGRQGYAARIGLALAAWLGLAGAVPAQPIGPNTRTARFTVSVVVDNDCQITHADDLAFGHAAGSPARLAQAQQVGWLSVACSRDTLYLLCLDRGSAPGSSVGHRLMAGSQPGNGNLLQYQLYLDAAGATVWGDGSSGSTGTVSGVGSGAAQAYAVYGWLPAQDRPSADRYASVVTASLTF